ncbi:MAG TPA: AAA family ATPase, partial [bacterium]|nr:AAA family ATPase [bacterium]
EYENIGEEHEQKKTYVLIIDEINRGNISRIFGELITLIEEDKRDGKLTAKLPYSQEDFTVPSNLFIIGTMNTADRSIALLDIALRRRFTFFRFDPRSELVGNTKAKEIMIKLNEEIVKSKGKDFQIGHSYFMKINSDEELKAVLTYKIKPLLEEYFVNDNKRLESLFKIADEEI